MSKRMYEEFDIDIDEIEQSDVKELILNAGQLYKISGLVFQGNGKDFLVMSPNACELDYQDELEYFEQPPIPICVDNIFDELTLAEFQAILKRTDDPLIFEQDETGTLKAIVRKSQRVVSGAVQQQIWHRDGFQCLFCGKGIPDGKQLTVDHWIPLEKGGASDPSNLITLCRQHNKDKGNQSPQAYCEKENLDYNGILLYLHGKAPKSFIYHLN